MYTKELINELQDKTMNIRDLIKSSKLFVQNVVMVLKDIDMMKKKGVLLQNNDNIHLNEKYVFGKLIIKGNFGFVLSGNEDKKDLYIYKTNMNGAINGDFVAAKVIDIDENEKERGAIVCILEESQNTIVGTLKKYPNCCFVVPDTNSTNDIYIGKQNTTNAGNDDKVVVKINKRAEGTKNPEGVITEVLGHSSDAGIEIECMVKNFNIDQNFPTDVIKEANSIDLEISPEELAKELKTRTDLRDKTIFTIDGDDTKDFDDAISIETLVNGNYLLGVHIADVTHYVKEDSPLDKEALNRGTSIYLVDRVIPMLPKQLSNGICSLNPKADRFALSCEMEIDSEGKVVNSKIFESVICSTERMTYNDVSAIIEKDDQEKIERYHNIYADLLKMKKLYEILRAKKQRDGAINLDLPECKIKIDENKKPIDIVLYDRNAATDLIEQFMVICNETIAEYFCTKNIPFLYRIHEKPSSEKLQRFIDFMDAIGYDIPNMEITPRMLSNILIDFEDKKEKDAVNKVMLRSMAKAKYSTEEIGHFGLANEFYSHFTSPIRRYPDLQIHRIIKDFLHNKLSNEKKNHYKKILVDVAKSTSEAEINAYNCERDVENYKKCEFMLNKYGEKFSGKVSGITEHGLFIELKNTVEGFLPSAELEKEGFFTYEENTYSYTSKEKSYTFGTQVTVEIGNIDMSKKQITFLLLKEEEQSI